MTNRSRCWSGVTSFVAGAVAASVPVMMTYATTNAAEGSPGPYESADVRETPKCARDDFGQVGAIEAPGKRSSRTIRGTRSKVWIPPKKTRCQRVGSVYVYSRSRSGLFEFGYLIGYSNCSRRTYHRPRVFYFASTTTGGTSCYVFGRKVRPRQFDTLAASDKNGNSVWGGYFNGHQLQPKGERLNFSRGWSVVAVERATRRDNGKARFHKIREYRKGRWSNWDRLTRVNRTDPDFKMKRINNHTGHVVHD